MPGLNQVLAAENLASLSACSRTPESSLHDPAGKSFCKRLITSRINHSKGIAIAGLTLGILLWFAVFLTIGGEWFLMWQSQEWNGQQSAFRLVVIFGFVLLYLVQPDREDEA